jgi:hypothetical protein
MNADVIISCGGNRRATERARSVIESYSGGLTLVVNENLAQMNVFKYDYTVH